MNYEIITAPLIGAAIGTITNGIAIKMLFRPWNPVYIGKFKLPFTPGLIPKEKPRIAASIAKVIGNNLLDESTIKKSLLSENTKEKIFATAEKVISSLSERTETLSEFLDSKCLMDKIDEKEKNLNKTASQKIADRLIETNAASSLVDFASKELEQNSNPLIAGFASKAISSARDSLITKINTLIKDKAPSLISEFVDREYEKIKHKTVQECIIYLEEKFPDYQQQLFSLYTKLVEKYLGNILRGFNVSEIVEQKINEFELPELEKLIMEIARKELNSLVLLGGLLGLIMGFLNVII